MASRFWTRAAPLTILVLGVSMPRCSFERGPLLEVAVVPASVRTTSTSDDPTLCCCHVLGTLVNRSSVAVHAVVRYRAVDRSNPAREIGPATDFIKNIPPGAQVPFEAVGFTASCNTIDRMELRLETDVIGLTSPP